MLCMKYEKPYKPLAILSSSIHSTGVMKILQIKMYEVLISYSAKDYIRVCHVLIKSLEDSEKGFKLCLHDKDFRVGETIADNVRDVVRVRG